MGMNICNGNSNIPIMGIKYTQWEFEYTQHGNEHMQWEFKYTDNGN